jgi:N-acetylglucosaminyldiphosphoundecaprenol N-acetyl-beta-D-mannosaminyltransferase
LYLPAVVAASQCTPGGRGRLAHEDVLAGRSSERIMRARAGGVRLGVLSFDAVTSADCAALIMAGLEAGRGGRIHTANVDHLYQAARDPSLAEFIEAADLVVADGVPLLWASRIRGTPLPARVAGSDLVWGIAESAARHGRSLFLAGGSPGTAEGAAAALRRRNPGIRLAGTSCPQFAPPSTAPALEALTRTLRRAQPEIVLLGLPPHLVREIVQQCAPALPAAWWIGVGVTFSFMAGVLPRAPHWQQVAGLEWLHRLAQEPRRLAGRYARDIPVALRLLGRSLAERWRLRE